MARALQRSAALGSSILSNRQQRAFLGAAASAVDYYRRRSDEFRNENGSINRVPFPGSNYNYLEEPSAYFPPLREELKAGEKLLEEEACDGPEPSYVIRNSGFEVFHHSAPFQCQITENPNHGVLPEMNIAYETWGTLNDDASNAILLHTGLSASSHAASHQKNEMKGWWEDFIGPGRALDTDKFFIVCSNNLGGCYGTTGPSSINPETDAPYSTQFPIITVDDMVHAQFLLLDHLGIGRLHASVGASLGGMQSLLAAALYPERVNSCISISASHRAHPTAIALRYMQRRIIMADPHWQGGDYYDGKFPVIGMKHAREVATISYRSGPEWAERFDRQRAVGTKTSFLPEFLIETYLDHQGTTACLRYDPNSLIYISKAMDLFDMTEGFADPVEAMGRIHCPTLVVGVQSDILFPVTQQREVVSLLKQSNKAPVTYFELDALYGHDTFLIDSHTVGAAVKGHLEHTASSAAGKRRQ